MAQTYDYGYWSPAPGGHTLCRIRTYQVGERTVCLATQRQDRFGGAALTDGAARIAAQAEGWHHPRHDGRFTWVEHYEFPRGPDPAGRWETFAFVAFQRGTAGELCRPEWRSTDRAAVEALIGQAIGP